MKQLNPLGFAACICLAAALSFAGPVIDDSPTRVQTTLEPGLSLNGSWEFRFEEGRPAAEVADAGFAATDSVPVPGCYDTMPKWYLKRGTGLYRRTFTLTEDVPNAWLVIDGMGLVGTFAIDGRALGTHPYPYARLELETGPLAKGEHVVFAALDNRFDWEILKLARPYYDFYSYGGFYHGVSLAFDNRRILVRTRDYTKGEVEIEVRGEEVEKRGGGGQWTLVFDGKNEVKATFKNNRATVCVPDFKLWSPEHPNLHTVTLSGAPQARFGIREIKAEKRGLWLNGKPLYLKGFNRHEAHPTFGAATPESLMLLDIQNLKAMGGNFFRGAHYQQAQRFLDLCDENGVLVWEESLGWGNGSHHAMAAGELTNGVFRAQQVRETREMVRASFNHPSVIVFGYMNEFLSSDPAGKSLADEIMRAVRAEDSGRLVTFACSHVWEDIANENTDLVAFNTYPGWFDGNGLGEHTNLVRRVKDDIDAIVALFRKRYPEKPIMISEIGTCSVYGARDRSAAQWTEDFQAEYDVAALDAVRENPELCGVTLWQFTDARSFHRSGGPLRGKPFAENLAGVYDGFRRPKLAVDAVTRSFGKLPSRDSTSAPYRAR